MCPKFCVQVPSYRKANISRYLYLSSFSLFCSCILCHLLLCVSFRLYHNVCFGLTYACPSCSCFDNEGRITTMILTETTITTAALLLNSLTCRADCGQHNRLACIGSRAHFGTHYTVFSHVHCSVRSRLTVIRIDPMVRSIVTFHNADMVHSRSQRQDETGSTCHQRRDRICK